MAIRLVQTGFQTVWLPDLNQIIHVNVLCLFCFSTV